MLRLLVLGICVLTRLCVFAGDKGDGKQATRKHPHGIHRHNFELFSGGTYFYGPHQTTLVTVGVDYEHRFRDFHNHFGVGLLADYEFKNDKRTSETLITPTLIYFPTKHMKVFIGIGCALTGQRTLLLWRAGLGYEFDLTEHFVVAPTLSLDHTSHYTALVYGLAFGIGI